MNDFEDMTTPRRSRVRKTHIAILAGVAVFCIVCAIFAYSRYAISDEDRAVAQSKAIIAKVGKLMLLPDTEPAVAIVTDASQLKVQQGFFANAENGDALLVYEGAQAILYRERENKIIAAGPVVSPGAATANVPLRIAFYNGTGVPGLARGLEERLHEANVPFVTAALTNATNRDYVDTLVIDLTGMHGSETQAIAAALSAVVGSLPGGEESPQADILVIAGTQSP